jgi:CBS domain containing-hemolysin-like protein
MTESALLALLFLISASLLSGTSNALHRLGKLQAEEMLKETNSPFFYRHILSGLFGKQIWKELLFCFGLTKYLLRIGFALFAFLTLIELTPWAHAFTVSQAGAVKIDLPITLLLGLLILLISLLTDCLFSLFSQIKPLSAFRLYAPFSSLLLVLSTPITAPAFKILKLLFPKSPQDKTLKPNFRIRDKVHELLQESELGNYLDSNEQKLILSVVSFKERIAREVMVPRINIFSLSAEDTLEEAAQNFLKEGYSRIPIYKDSVDNIIGVLLYKDLLKVYIDQRQFQQKIETLLKPVLYAPETKKISHLLQEFRSKQIHLAIVVDEWGGTEGIVTIEDILEELVGEIADEYDIGQVELFSSVPGGGWIVDSKMSIIDIQEELGVKIPFGPEYDTIGGYIYHRAGAIPAKGWRIHHDDFDLEVVSSSERAVEKIRITPH